MRLGNVLVKVVLRKVGWTSVARFRSLIRPVNEYNVSLPAKVSYCLVAGMIFHGLLFH